MDTSIIAISNFFKRWMGGSSIVLAVAAICMMFGTTTLRAGCVEPGIHPHGALFEPSAFMAAPGALPASDEDEGHASIIGFWHVLLLIDNNPATPLFQSIVQYHPGGMEIELADRNSIQGSSCMGVWKQEGNTVQIYHIAWLFQGGTGDLDGYAVITQKNKLSRDGNSFSGEFEFIQYDNSGAKLADLHGSTTGKRIDFHHPFTLF